MLAKDAVSGKLAEMQLLMTLDTMLCLQLNLKQNMKKQNRNSNSWKNK